MTWEAEPPAPSRSREQAFALAKAIASRAAAEPQKFAQLAQQYSEDVVTRMTGGSLGGIPASQLRGSDPALLDALAALRPGEVSHVIETAHGFEILLRRAPPPPTKLAARRVVVAYDGTVLPGKHTLMRGRTRSDAQSIARDISHEVRADGSQFDRFLQQYPPHDDEPGGFIGIWSNQEPGPFGRERECLAAMDPGETTDPIDSAQGFEVLQRVSIPETPEYTMEVVRLAFLPDSRATVSGLTESVAREIRKTPARLAEFQDRYCCIGAERWSLGRTPGELMDAAARLRIGDTFAAPVEARSAFVIAKRIEAATAVLPPTSFELPSPSVASVEQIATTYSGSAVQKLVRGLGKEAGLVIDLVPPAADRFEELHRQLALAFDNVQSRENRRQAISAFFDELSFVLSAEQYAKYRQFVDARVSAKLMQMY